MRNAKGKPTLLVAVFAAAATLQPHLAGAEQPAPPQQTPRTEAIPVQTQWVPAETELVADELAVLPPITRRLVPGQFTTYRPPARPLWYFEAEGLALKRDASGDRAFAALVTRVWTEVVPDPPPDPPEPSEWVSQDFETIVLGTQDLRFDFRGGGRALVGRTLGDWYAVEGSYFGLSSWKERASVRDATEFVAEVDDLGEPTTTYPASLFSPFSDFGLPPILGLDFNNLASISYSSRLESIELNLRQRLPMLFGRLQTSVLVGGRYLGVHETFAYHTASDVPDPGTTNDVTTRTGNRMLGVQIGAEFEFQVEPRWWVDCEVKGALFDNRADQRTVYVHGGSSLEAPYVNDYTGSRAENRSSFAVDVSLMLTYQVSPRLSARLGYQALWVDGVALASENFDPDVVLMNQEDVARLVSRGEVVYHGPRLGVAWVW